VVLFLEVGEGHASNPDPRFNVRECSRDVDSDW